MAVRKSYWSHRVKLIYQQNRVVSGGSREPCSFQLLEAVHVPGLLALSLRFLIFTSPSLTLTLQPLSYKDPFDYIGSICTKQNNLPTSISLI